MDESRLPRNLEQIRARHVLARHARGSDPATLAEAVQTSLGYVSSEVIPDIAARADVSPSSVSALVHDDERLLAEPPGRHRVTICTGTTCARWGGAKLVRLARKTLGIDLYRTTPDQAIRLDPFKCMGKCAMAPNVRIDGGVRGAMTEERFRLLLGVLSKRP